MLQTLPLDDILIDQIYNIDMSKFLNDDIYIDVKTYFVYLRNIDIGTNSLTLFFDTCTYKRKEIFLLDYLTTDICIELKELSQTWFIILKTYFDHTPPIDLSKSILSQDEIYMFISKNYYFIQNVVSVLRSSYEYAKTLMKINVVFDKSNETQQININICSLFKYIQDIEIDILKTSNNVVFYKQLFNSMNDQYFQTLLSNSKYLVLEYGRTTSQWQKFQELIRAMMKTTSNV